MSDTSNPKVGNFKVGDLVTLSAYRRSTYQNSLESRAEETEGTELLGLVHQITTGRYPIHVKWVRRQVYCRLYGEERTLIDRFFFRELKKLNK